MMPVLKPKQTMEKTQPTTPHTTTTTIGSSSNTRRKGREATRQPARGQESAVSLTESLASHLEVFRDGLPAVVVAADGVGRRQHGTPSRERRNHAFSFQTRGEQNRERIPGRARLRGGDYNSNRISDYEAAHTAFHVVAVGRGPRFRRTARQNLKKCMAEWS